MEQTLYPIIDKRLGQSDAKVLLELAEDYKRQYIALGETVPAELEDKISQYKKLINQ